MKTFPEFCQTSPDDKILQFSHLIRFTTSSRGCLFAFSTYATRIELLCWNDTKQKTQNQWMGWAMKRAEKLEKVTNWCKQAKPAMRLSFEECHCHVRRSSTPLHPHSVTTWWVDFVSHSKAPQCIEISIKETFVDWKHWIFVVASSMATLKFIC